MCVSLMAAYGCHISVLHPLTPDARFPIMFDLKVYLEGKRRLIDSALDREMPRETERPARLHKAMRYSVFSGGKRLRPALCMAAAEALDAPESCALLPGLAVELLHSYTLIHDDLPCMDDDALRRGKPTVHVAFGEAVAILAGDALQALAFELPTRSPAPCANRVVRQVAELARAAGSCGVIGGQVEDLAATDGAPSPDTMDFIHLHKTADLFRAAVRMGAVAADCDEERLASLTRYAECLGLAFQMSDDILDENQKDTQNRQEASCLQVMDRAAAENKTRDLVNEAIASLECFEPERIAPLAGIARLTADRILPENL